MELKEGQTFSKKCGLEEEQRKESDLHPLGRWCIAEVDTGLLQITESHCREERRKRSKTHFNRVTGHQLQQAPAKANTHPETEGEGQVTGDEMK